MDSPDSLRERDRITVLSSFSCGLEVRDRAKFQQDGHYVAPAINAPEVYILTYTDEQGRQLLRVQGNTLEQAMAGMRLGLSDLLHSLWWRGQIQQGIQAQFRDLNADRNRLSEWIAAHYQSELAGGGLNGVPVVDLAIHFLTQERSRWWVRVRNFLGGSGPGHNGGHLVPPPSAPHGDGV